MNVSIEDADLTFFDTETTGLDPDGGDRIVEIAALRYKGGKTGAVFQSLIDPGRPISAAAFQVNRITPEELRGSPACADVLPQFLDFAKGSCLCSYNAPFDMAFLESELARAGLACPEDSAVVDILRMARRLLPGLGRYALWFIAEHLGVEERQQHRAMSDVRMTVEVFKRLRQKAREKGINDYHSFLYLFGVKSPFQESMTTRRLAELQEAINLGVKAQIRYLSSQTAQVTERVIIPRQIKKDGDRYYVVAHCSVKEEERTFRIDGILHLEIV